MPHPLIPHRVGRFAYAPQDLKMVS